MVETPSGTRSRDRRIRPPVHPRLDVDRHDNAFFQLDHVLHVHMPLPHVSHSRISSNTRWLSLMSLFATNVSLDLLNRSSAFERVE